MNLLPHNSELLCSVCGQAILAPFFYEDELPTLCSVLFESKEAGKQAPRGECELAFCPACGWITNTLFSPELINYSAAYDNALHFSHRFGAYANDLARRLIQDHKLSEKVVVEIGCGDGHFLALIAESGTKSCLGFDPSSAYVQTVQHQSVEIIPKLFDGSSIEHCDFVICRHVLEHISNPKNWLDNLRQAIEDSGSPKLYFEVPNSYFIFRDLSVWDIIYEHCNYFVPETLKFLFEICGFEVTNYGTSFGDQYAFVEAELANPDSQLMEVPQLQEAEILTQLASEFASLYSAKVEGWRQNIKGIRQNHDRTIAWGAGSKGVMFAKLMGDSYKDHQFVDLNPRKAGKFLPLSAKQVILPEQLSDAAPGAILVMNPLYVDEIRAILDNLGCNSTIYVV
jgi:SAM-dependent methyltransferase